MTTTTSTAIIAMRKRKQINDLKWHMYYTEYMLTVNVKTRIVLIATSDFIYTFRIISMAISNDNSMTFTESWSEKIEAVATFLAHSRSCFLC